MSIYEKLMQIQRELKAPKGQYNSFGKYKYRSCEDILEAVKPILSKHGCAAVITDTLVHTGERYYVQATAILYDTETGDAVCNSAYAREEETKKGMDGSQITGTASSYARKYALNGLFLIDDTKDADTDAYHEQTQKDSPKAELVGKVEIETLKKVANALGAKTKNEFRAVIGIPYSEIEKLTKTEWGALMVELNQKMDDAAQQRAMQDDA